VNGPWRITAESWITPNANWYGRRVFVIDANSLPEAMRKIAELPADVYLDEDRLTLKRGKAPAVDVPDAP
jgi:hypothetical protein